MVPFLGRLSLRDWPRLLFAFSFLLGEQILRLVVVLFPPFRWAAEYISRFLFTSGTEALASFDEIRRKARGVPSDVKLSSDDIAEEDGDLVFSEIDRALERMENVEDFVRFWGFILEPHYVTTEDGFILTLHRIPYSRAESSARASGSLAPQQSPSKPHATKPAVLIWHGFLMCSEIWVCQPVMEKNLAFVLAEAGYDVWLGNTRGNKYSSKHLKYKRGEEAYWDFSMDTLALFDMPAAVNYIIKTAGVPTLSYIGFSQGTAQGFSSLSLKRDLNKKVNIFIALAPATKPKGLENKFINSLISAHPEVIYLLFGRKVLLSSTHFWSSILSPRTYAAVIDACMWFLFGWTSQCIDHKNIVYRHLYSYTSVKTVVHWFQIMRVKRFQMYDENPTVIANASTGHVVPRHPTEHIQTPVALFYGGKDTLPDTQYIIRNSPTPVFCLQVLEYEHLSFI
ncbi:sterol esterase-like protein [Cladochytrium replicatum]|nr:sterol esterase-like protein [Cladochytrium replicatum]